MALVTNKDTPCLYILVSAFLLLASIATYSFLSGSLPRLLFPTNTLGEVCDHARPYLLYLDLSLCTTPHLCSSPTICIPTCPTTYWTKDQGTSPGLQNFCMAGTNLSTSLAQLVAERLCPAYLVPSTAVQGRCVPVQELHQAKVENIKTSEGENITPEILYRGADYVISDITKQMQILADVLNNWWAAILCFFFTFLLFIIWSVIINIFTKYVLITTIIISPLLLAGISVSSIVMFVMAKEVNHEDEEVSRTTIIRTKYSILVFGIITCILAISVSMILLFSSKLIAPALYLISETMQTIKYTKSIVFLILGEFLVSSSLMFLSVLIICLLATSGAPEHRVVNSCPSETCLNTDTNTMFISGDICSPHIFQECTGCPKAQCLFYNYNYPALTYVLQFLVIVAAIFLVYTLQSVVAITLAAKFTNTEKTNDNIGNILLRTCHHHVGAAACQSLLCFLCHGKASLGYLFTAVGGDDFFTAKQKSISLFEKYHNTSVGNIHRVSQMVIFLAKILIVGIMAATVLVINYLSYLHSIIIIFIIFILSSNMFSIHHVALDSFLLLFLEDWEKQGKVRKSCSDNNLPEILGLRAEISGVDNTIAMNIIAEE